LKEFEQLVCMLTSNDIHVIQKLNNALKTLLEDVFSKKKGTGISRFLFSGGMK